MDDNDKWIYATSVYVYGKKLMVLIFIRMNILVNACYLRMRVAWSIQWVYAFDGYVHVMCSCTIHTYPPSFTRNVFLHSSNHRNVTSSIWLNTFKCIPNTRDTFVNRIYIAMQMYAIGRRQFKLPVRAGSSQNLVVTILTLTFLLMRNNRILTGNYVYLETKYVSRAFIHTWAKTLANTLRHTSTYTPLPPIKL
jgi:hypothetical protein